MTTQSPPTITLGTDATAASVQSIDAMVELASGQYVLLYEVPTTGNAVSATFNYRIVTHNLSSDITIRVAKVVVANWTVGANPQGGWIMPVDLDIGPNGVNVGVVEDTAIVMSPGIGLVVYANGGSNTGVCASAALHGFLKIGS